jgi:predicted amidophosphoribosyltransferase
VHCHDTQFRFHRLLALGVYADQLEEFVLRMKHPGSEPLLLAAGALLAEYIAEQRITPRPTVVAPIPMHWWRRMTRGLHAPGVLAEAVATRLQLPLRPALGYVRRLTPRQATLTPARRRRNMRQAFGISRWYSLQNTHVLVIDDVLTTGATANAFAHALRTAGAAEVTLAVLARGIGQR